MHITTTNRRRRISSIHAAAEDGQTLSEYSVLVAFIAIVLVAAVPGIAVAVEKLLAPATAFFGG